MNFNPLKDIVIRNAQIINEGTRHVADVWIKAGRIHRIDSSIHGITQAFEIEANGAWLLPGMIDDQVHFRDSGYPQQNHNKGNIATESSAAVVGGITSYMDMPNTQPPTLSLETLAQKKQVASQNSLANYAFHFGVSQDNLDVIAHLDPKLVSGVKVFMGASTGNLLVDDPKTLETLFANVPTILLTHCESTPMIRRNEALYIAQYGDDIPARYHPQIRDVEACFASSSFAVELAKKYHTQLHVLHITTAKELQLFQNAPLDQKNITAEVCIHHLSFDDRDYDLLKHLIKCNPAIKSAHDRQALIEAVAQSELIDIIGTDHAPHTWQEKQLPYTQAPAGLPLVQHALPALLELVAEQKLSLETLVRKTSHQVAERFKIQERGYIREGYWADLVLIEENTAHQSVREQTNYMRCGWTPFQDKTFRYLVGTTIVSGQLAWHQQRLNLSCKGEALSFNR